MSVLSEFRLYICNHIVGSIPSHTIRLWYYKRIMNFKIGKGSTIFMNCKFDCAGGFILGDNSVINANCRLDSRGGLKIGNNVSISENVILLTADHDMDSSNFSGRNGTVLINDYVWLGTNSMVLMGVTVNIGAVIAAGAVVHKDVESYNVVGGIPAKFIRTRNNNLNYKISYKRLFQ